jgi:hypothetical protein
VLKRAAAKIAAFVFDEREKAAAQAANPTSPLGLQVAMGPDYAVMAANGSRNLREGRTGLIEAVVQRR